LANARGEQFEEPEAATAEQRTLTLQRQPISQAVPPRVL